MFVDVIKVIHTDGFPTIISEYVKFAYVGTLLSLRLYTTSLNEEYVFTTVIELRLSIFGANICILAYPCAEPFTVLERTMIG